MVSIVKGYDSSSEFGARMIVFVPKMPQDVANFARQIYAQAVARQRRVLFLAVNSREEEILSNARQLTMLTALTQDDQVRASAMQVKVGDWLDALVSLTHPGDLVIWPEERYLAPASVENALGISQLVLPAARVNLSTRASPWIRITLFWLIQVIILAGFFFLEVRLDQMIHGPLLKVIIVALIVLEIGALYEMDQLFH